MVTAYNLCLIKNSKILVLDEATANVDLETDNFIQKKLRENFKESTVMIIAHRLATIKKADKIIVMDNGKVIEQGSHDELVDLKVDLIVTVDCWTRDIDVIKYAKEKFGSL